MKCKQCGRVFEKADNICPNCETDNSDSGSVEEPLSDPLSGSSVEPSATDPIVENDIDNEKNKNQQSDGSNQSPTPDHEMIGAQVADQIKENAEKALSQAGAVMADGGSKVLHSMKKGGVSFIQLIKSPTVEQHIDSVSCLWLVLLEWVMMTLFFALIGTTLIKTLLTLNQFITMSSFGVYAIDLKMAWYVPIICGLILLIAHYVVFQLALFIGKRKFSLTTVIAHSLVPSLALGLCGVLTLIFSVFKLTSIWVLIPLVLLWLSSTMIVVVDDLKINHYYIRIMVMTIIGCVLIATLLYAFYAVMDGIHLNISNLTTPGSINYGSVVDVLDGFLEQF